MKVVKDVHHSCFNYDVQGGKLGNELDIEGTISSRFIILTILST